MSQPMSQPPVAPAEQIAQAFAQVTANQDQAQQTPPAAEQQQPAATQEFTPEYVARLRDEAAQYRVKAALVDGISAADLNALTPLLEALRTGDTDTIDQWAEGLYESRGLSARANTPQQQQAAANVEQQVQQQAAQGTPLTADEVKALFREELRQVEQGWRQEQARLDAQAQIEAKFRDLGLEPNSEVARSVARIGAQMSRDQNRFVEPAEAFDEWKKIMAPVLGVQQPQQQAPGHVPPAAPPAAPPGVPAMTPDTRSPEERSLARLMAARQPG